MNTLDLCQYSPVIPVIVIDKLEHAIPMAQALVAGGVRVLEITLRTPVALEAMRQIAAHVPEAIVGAGTVRNAQDAHRAKEAGCQFAVSPGFTVEVSQACAEVDLPLLPGVGSASEVMLANSHGHQFLKFFPAVAAGGLAMLKAWAGPFPDVTFCPTGGITPQSAPEFLALPNVRVCGGSWLTPAQAMNEGRWQDITALAQQACTLRT